MRFKLLVLAFVVFQFSYSQNFKFGKVSKEELLQKEHPLEPSSNAAVLYRENITYFEYSSDEGFFIITEVFERIKIYNKEGFDQATKRVTLYQGKGNSNESISGLKAYTYNLDSSNKIEKVKLKNDGIFEEDINTYFKQKKFTMPDLQEGCIIEYKYRITSPFISDIDEYRFQEKIPVNEVYISFKAPEYFAYKTHEKGWLDFQIKNDGQTRTIEYTYTKIGVLTNEVADKSIKSELKFLEKSYKVRMRNVPAIIEEAYAGNINNYMSGLKFELSHTKYPNSPYKSYATDWNFVAKSIYESLSFGNELDKYKYFSKDMDNLLSGISNDEEKMIRIFEFVKSKMSWNGFHSVFVNKGVKNAYKDGTGNTAEINLMLTAMFKYAKLNANPILVSTKSNGISVFPTRSGFNYVLSGVEVNNAVLLFDATSKNSEVNILSSKLLNWKGRLIREDGSSAWAPLIPNKPAVRNVMLNATITEDLVVSGLVKMRMTGHFSKETRELYENVVEDDIRKSLEKEKGEIEISDIEFKNLETLYKPIDLSYNFESEDLVEEIGGKLYFSPMLFIGEKKSPFKLEDRKYPVDFEFPKKNRVIFNIEIPDGYTVESLPENASFGLANNDLTLKYQVSSQGKFVNLMVDFSINKTVIAADQYASLKGYYQLLIEKFNEKVVLVKK